MTKTKMSKVKNGLKGLWSGIDLARRILLNVVFLVIFFAILGLLTGKKKPEVPETGALVLHPVGAIVEQVASDPMEKIRGEITGSSQAQTLLKDLVDAVNAAKDDERITVLLLDLSDMGGAGMTKLNDLKQAILSFKESGKKVVAFSDEYSQNAYYLAALADEIHMHHLGMLLLEGFGRYKTYYKEGLDKLKVDVHVFKVGTFKSAVEPYLLNGMSDAAREANLEWLGDLWNHYLADVAEARGKSVADLQAYIDNVQENLEKVSGDGGKMALEAGLVDFVGSRDAIRNRMIELVGENEDKHTFHQISHGKYLASLKDDRFGERARGDQVAVIVAVGTIMDGNQPGGTIGGDSTARLIRQAREDENIKAVVLRVDSGGGGVFPSEVIRRELELTREAGKPVVSSMGTVAASGGYWITMASDEVWAYPTTITGSIGIFGMFPNYHRALRDYLGVRVDGVGTTPLAGAIRPDRELKKEFGDMIQMIINKGYHDFISKVAEARGMTLEDVDKIAQGRVWSGEDAHALGLVDQLGGLEDAIASAAKLADLGDDYKVKYMKKKKTFKEKLMKNLLNGTAEMVVQEAGLQHAFPMDTGLAGMVMRQMEVYRKFNDPNGMYAYFHFEDRKSVV